MPTNEQPNILVFLTDDHGQWAANCYGTRELFTPAMDYLADSGAKLTMAFTPTPVCSPARASFFTGRLPSQHGIHDWVQEREQGMDHPGIVEQTNIGQLLQGAGYQTALVGKWHCGRSWEPHPGFDKWFSYFKTQSPHLGEQEFSDDGEPVKEQGYQAQLLTDHAIEFLRERDRQNPFFLFVGYVNTHTPHKDQPLRLVNQYRKCTFDNIPREEFAECHGKSRFVVTDYEDPEYRESLAQYYAAVTTIDEQMGRVLDELEGTGDMEKTLVVYTADHGLMKGHHGNQLKGNSTIPQNFIEESILVPCLISWPKKIPAGQEIDELVDHCDLFATLLEAAGAEVDEVTRTEINSPGESYLPMLRGTSEKPWRDAVFGEYGNARMIRTKEHKLILRYPGSTGQFPNELYDLVNDPRETKNVFDDADSSEVVEQLTARLNEHFGRYEIPERSGLRLDEQPVHNSDEPWRQV